MDGKLRQIEVDAETADLLEARAAARGISVAEFVADLACNQGVLPPDLAAQRTDGEGPWSPEVLEQDARRLAEFERARLGVPWSEIEPWLRSWGSANELPTPKPRRL